MDDLSKAQMLIDDSKDVPTLHVMDKQAPRAELEGLHRTLSSMLEQYERAEVPIGWHMPSHFLESIERGNVRRVQFQSSISEAPDLVIDDVTIDYGKERQTLILQRSR